MTGLLVGFWRGVRGGKRPGGTAGKLQRWGRRHREPSPAQVPSRARIGNGETFRPQSLRRRGGDVRPIPPLHVARAVNPAPGAPPARDGASARASPTRPSRRVPARRGGTWTHARPAPADTFSFPTPPHTTWTHQKFQEPGGSLAAHATGSRPVRCVPVQVYAPAVQRYPVQTSAGFGQLAVSRTSCLPHCFRVRVERPSPELGIIGNCRGLLVRPSPHLFPPPCHVTLDQGSCNISSLVSRHQTHILLLYTVMIPSILEYARRREPIMQKQRVFLGGAKIRHTHTQKPFELMNGIVNTERGNSS